MVEVTDRLSFILQPTFSFTDDVCYTARSDRSHRDDTQGQGQPASGVYSANVTFFILERHLDTHSLQVVTADGFEKIMKMVHPNLLRDTWFSKQEWRSGASVVMVVGKVSITGGDYAASGSGSLGIEYSGQEGRLYKMVKNSLIPGVPLLIPNNANSEWISLGVAAVHPSIKKRMNIRVVPQKFNESKKLPPLPPSSDGAVSCEHAPLQTNWKTKAKGSMGTKELSASKSGHRSTITPLPSASASIPSSSFHSDSVSVSPSHILSFKERMRWHELRRMASRMVFAVSNVALKRHHRTVVQCDIGHLEKSFQRDVSKYVVPFGHNGRRGVESELRYENVCRFLSKHGSSTRIIVSSARLVHADHQSVSMPIVSKFPSSTMSKPIHHSCSESCSEDPMVGDRKTKFPSWERAKEERKRAHLRFSDGAHRFAVFRDLNVFDAFPLVVPMGQAPLFKQLFPVGKNSKCPQVVDDDTTKFTSHQWHSSKDYKFLEMGDRKMRECYISVDFKVPASC
eukprot:TRINITY_DN17526_c0_g1_i2.p1 TRINITY_DN17526_c0_g1~~TRINITY_DN17526_c0_g1_i2.p1  ORF type:complete len:511 (+),score=103.31 TRINITY_DN17526_c0_g1_i2:59-1591(+)